jgi:hypothetical protein
MARYQDRAAGIGGMPRSFRFSQMSDEMTLGLLGKLANVNIFENPPRPAAGVVYLGRLLCVFRVF